MGRQLYRSFLLSRSSPSRGTERQRKSVDIVKRNVDRLVLSSYFSLLSDATGNRIPDVPHSRLVTHLSFAGCLMLPAGRVALQDCRVGYVKFHDFNAAIKK